VGVAVPDSIWDFRVRRLKEMGSNAFRCAHNAPANEFLEACDDARPSSTDISGQQYPRIPSDRRVEFRLKAPDAKTVRLHLDKDYDLERGSDGLWSITTGGLAA
jgi:hypothetical protein